MQAKEAEILAAIIVDRDHLRSWTADLQRELADSERARAELAQALEARSVALRLTERDLARARTWEQVEAAMNAADATMPPTESEELPDEPSPRWREQFGRFLFGEGTLV